MNKATSTLCIVAVLAPLLLPSHRAKAYYDPGVQRWVNRDPLEEQGFETAVPGVRHRSRRTDFIFVGNNPANYGDAYGLAIWVCVRPSPIGLWLLNHAYFWNDKTREACGRNRSRGGPPGTQREAGPRRDDCEKVPGSDTKADAVMQCCRDIANNGFFIPFKNDCHKPIRDCLANNNLQDPGHPYFGGTWTTIPDGWPPPW